MSFLGELRSNDGQGAQLFEAYLSVTFRAGTPAERRGGTRRSAASRGMTADEAYLVLGLAAGRRATRSKPRIAS